MDRQENYGDQYGDQYAIQSCGSGRRDIQDKKKRGTLYRSNKRPREKIQRGGERRMRLTGISARIIMMTNVGSKPSWERLSYFLCKERHQVTAAAVLWCPPSACVIVAFHCQALRYRKSSNPLHHTSLRKGITSVVDPWHFGTGPGIRISD